MLTETDAFVPDLRLPEKYLMTLSPHGFLKRVK